MFSKSFAAFVSAALALSSVASAAVTHTTGRVPSHYSHIAAAPDAKTFSYTITLQGEHEDALEAKLYDISLSGGNWLSDEELSTYIKPKDEHLAAVKAHLAAHGVAEQDITSSRLGDRLLVKSTVAQANAAWNTSLNQYAIKNHGTATRATSYTIPDDLEDAIFGVHPITSFDAPRKQLPTNMGKRLNQEAVTAQDLRALYGLDQYTPTNSNSGLDVVLFAYSGGTGISPSDLEQYIETYRPSAKGYHLEIKSGPGAPANDPGNADAESALDVDTVVGLAAPLKAGYYLANGNNDDFSVSLTDSLNDFLDTFTDRPKVVSVSYGVSEADVSQGDALSFNAAAKRLTATGVTIIYASGDAGLEGGHDEGQDCKSDGFGVSYPSGSPYILSVGAVVGNTPTVANNVDESGFYSSSGYSNFFSTPSYQKSAVANYASHIPSINKGHFNPNGRAFPDVSANGWGFLTILQGQVSPVGGTSASAPAIAAVLGLVNNYRKAHGQDVLGFANPKFYQHPEVWDEVTSGSAAGCDNYNYYFPATGGGWNAAAGLGTPNLQKLFTLP